jgi:cytochrome c-type biogenesis protein CcmF
MIAEISHFCLLLAFALSVVQCGFGIRHRHPPSTALTASASTAQFVCVSIALAGLMLCYATSDFSVLNVVENSSRDKPMLFKLTGTWGNHEGSMLLWLWVLSLFGFLIGGAKNMDGSLKTATLSIQGLLCVGVAAFILFTSNPFERVFPPPYDGQDLNPLLQDIGLAIHPPMLYLGYVGFSIVFSLAVAALITGRVDQAWARVVQPWVLVSWSFLTLGIGLGSWWAYRELGWGGFWFWDPVENASLLPWFTGTALLHSNLVLMKRNLLKKWVILLSIITFSMSMIGTFLVRSGALTSVHSFANDPDRGLFILIYLTLVTGLSLWLFALRAPSIRSFHAAQPLSREGMIVLNNLFMVTAAATVLFATLYPMAIDIMNLAPVSIGPFYFNVTVLPIIGIAILLAGIAPFLQWKQAVWKELLTTLSTLGMVVLATGLITLSVLDKNTVIASLAFCLSVWLAGSAIWLWFRIAAKSSSPSIIKRAFNVPRTYYGMLLAHLGAALVVAGITGASLLKLSHEQPIQAGEHFTLGTHELSLSEEIQYNQHNYESDKAVFSVSRDGEPYATLTPEIRHFGIRSMQTSEAAIESTLFYDLYLVIGKALDGKTTTVRAYINPLINILWLGVLLMGLGGVLAIRTTKSGAR